MFNRNILFVPVEGANLRRFDIKTVPATPAALADLATGLGIQIVSVALFSNGDLCLLDNLNGRLIRKPQVGAPTWNIDCRAATEVPFQIAIDSLDQVWVGMDGGQVARFDSTGTLLNRIADSNNRIVQASAGTFIVAYNDVTGYIIEVDVVSGTVLNEFNISDLSTHHQPTPVTQIGMLDAKFFIPVQRKPSDPVNPGQYEILEIATATLLAILPLQWPRALRGTMCDANGVIWAMDEFSALVRFLSDTTLGAIYFLESLGRLDAMALSETAAVAYVISDDLFGSARVHALDPNVGVSTYLEYSGAPIHGGDLSGYQRASVTAVPSLGDNPPVVDTSLIQGLIFAGSTVITGAPGSVVYGTSVSCSVGSATIEADGSFVIRGVHTSPATIVLTFTGPGGTSTGNVTTANHTETATFAQFQGTEFGLSGGYLAIALADGSGPISTGQHYVRIRDLSSGKYWNGNSFVASNGFWAALTYSESGLWTYFFNPGVAGNYAAFFLENGVNAYDSIQVTSERNDVANILSLVKNIGAPGAAMLAPTSLFNDETKIGGFLAGRLDRLQFLLNILTQSAQVVFPKLVEGVSAIVSSTSLKQGDTPLVLLTILDAATGVPKDITGHTIIFRSRTQPGGQLIFSRFVTLVDGSIGSCQVRLTAQDTGVAGSFLAEVVDIGPDGVVLTTQNFNLTLSQTLG